VALLWLGNIKLEALTVLDMPSSRSWDYAPQKTIEGLPVLQFNGRDANTYELNVRIHPALGTPQSIIRELGSAGDGGEVMVLQTGTGEQLGSYVLKGLDQKRILTTPKGEILVADLSLKLLEHRPIDIEFKDGVAIEGTTADTTAQPEAVDDSREPSEVPLSEIVRSG